MLPAFAVLARYAKQCPDNASGLHLFGLICERLGQLELGAEMMIRSISILESLYEEAEDSTVERQFNIANCNLARLRLSIGDCVGAIESYESVLGLLPDEADDRDDEARVLRTQAEFGIGLANFNLGDIQEALSHFERAVEAAGQDVLMKGHAMVLLAQTLWAIGTDESRELAQSRLLEWLVKILLLVFGPVLMFSPV